MDQSLCDCGKPISLAVKGPIKVCSECWEIQVKMFEEYDRNRKIIEPQMDMIIERLYLGNADASRTKELLQEKGVSHILVAGDFLTVAYPDEYTYKQISLQDQPDEDIKRYFIESAKFIHNALRNGKTVFVHCAAGVSRSASIIISYLMIINKWDFDETYQMVKSKRSIIFPNSGFREQLRELAIQIKNGELKIDFDQE